MSKSDSSPLRLFTQEKIDNLLRSKEKDNPNIQAALKIGGLTSSVFHLLAADLPDHKMSLSEAQQEFGFLTAGLPDKGRAVLDLVSASLATGVPNPIGAVALQTVTKLIQEKSEDGFTLNQEWILEDFGEKSLSSLKSLAQVGNFEKQYEYGVRTQNRELLVALNYIIKFQVMLTVNGVSNSLIDLVQDDKNHDFLRFLIEQFKVNLLDSTLGSERASSNELIFYATLGGSVKNAEYLLRQGLNVNHSYKDIQTPLHQAVSSKNPDMVELLLKHKARIDLQDINGNTPLHLAYWFRQKAAKNPGDIAKKTQEILALLSKSPGVAEVMKIKNNEGQLIKDLASAKSIALIKLESAYKKPQTPLQSETMDALFTPMLKFRELFVDTVSESSKERLLELVKSIKTFINNKKLLGSQDLVINKQVSIEVYNCYTKMVLAMFDGNMLKAAAYELLEYFPETLFLERNIEKIKLKLQLFNTIQEINYCNGEYQEFLANKEKTEKLSQKFVKLVKKKLGSESYFQKVLSVDAIMTGTILEQMGFYDQALEKFEMVKKTLLKDMGFDQVLKFMSAKLLVFLKRNQLDKVFQELSALKDDNLKAQTAIKLFFDFGQRNLANVFNKLKLSPEYMRQKLVEYGIGYGYDLDSLMAVFKNHAQNLIRAGEVSSVGNTIVSTLKILQYKQRFEEATKYFEQINEQMPRLAIENHDLVKLKCLLAKLYIQAGNAGQATKILDNINAKLDFYKQHPDMLKTFLFAAYNYVKNGNYGLTEKCLKALVKITPEAGGLLKTFSGIKPEPVKLKIKNIKEPTLEDLEILFENISLVQARREPQKEFTQEYFTDGTGVLDGMSLTSWKTPSGCFSTIDNDGVFSIAGKAGYFGIIAPEITKRLDPSVLGQIQISIEKGFVKRAVGANGIKIVDNKIIEIKIKADLRIFGHKVYVNEEGQHLIVFDDLGNHEAIKRMLPTLLPIKPVLVEMESEHGVSLPLYSESHHQTTSSTTEDDSEVLGAADDGVE